MRDENLDDKAPTNPGEPRSEPDIIEITVVFDTGRKRLFYVDPRAEIIPQVREIQREMERNHQ